MPGETLTLLYPWLEIYVAVQLRRGRFVGYGGRRVGMWFVFRHFCCRAGRTPAADALSTVGSWLRYLAQKR